MIEHDTYDLIVIGGGPAGYPAAIRAAQLGKRVACIEKERPGGTCLNWGCIPTKALLKSASVYDSIKKSSTYGIYTENVRFDFAHVVQRSRGISDTMGKGVDYLLKKNKVTSLQGSARILEGNKILITDGKDSNQCLGYTDLLIATGCKPRTLPHCMVDGKRIMTSREALDMKTLPKSIAILGGGAIGVEFAHFLNTFGCTVHLIEMQSSIVAQEDRELASMLDRSLRNQGIYIYTDTKAENVIVHEHSVELHLSHPNSSKTIEVESVLLAIGVVPNLDGLLSEGHSLQLTASGHVQVDANYKTNLPHIYAAGDIIGPPWLAHVATFEAIQCINALYTGQAPKPLQNIPSCTYCYPQVASVGLTEEAAKKQNLTYRVGKFPFTASGKAVTSGYTEGFVKLLIGEHDAILGAHIVGPDATELIAEYVLAMSMEATAEEICTAIHAHPTLSETLQEAASAALGHAIHV